VFEITVSVEPAAKNAHHNRTKGYYQTEEVIVVDVAIVGQVKSK
jgi:hypothetical protein